MFQWSSIVFYVEALKTTVSLIVLLVLSIQDYRTRELDARIVYLYLAFSICISLASFLTVEIPTLLKLFYYIVSLSTTGGLFFILYKSGLIGDGDLYTTVSLGFLFPLPSTYQFTIYNPPGSGILPPSIMIVLYGSISVIILMIVNATFVLVKYKFIVARTPLKYAVILPFLGKPVRVSDYVEGKYRHYYPLQYYRVVNGGVVVEYKLVTRVLGEDGKDVSSLLERGFVKPEDYIWVSPGIPFILYLLVGFIMLLILGDYPLIAILTRK
jgi:preflagellin peptidase FlaK